MEKKTDARIQKTKEALRKALFTLSKSKDISEITVSELCKEASVNRSTFYKYYSLPQDVLMELINDFFDSQVEYFVNRDRQIHLEEDMTRTLNAIKRDKNSFQLAMSISELPALFTDRFISILSSGNIREKYFIAGGMTAVVSNWIKNDCSTSPEELARTLITMIQKQLR